MGSLNEACLHWINACCLLCVVPHVKIWTPPLNGHRLSLGTIYSMYVQYFQCNISEDPELTKLPPSLVVFKLLKDFIKWKIGYGQNCILFFKNHLNSSAAKNSIYRYKSVFRKKNYYMSLDHTHPNRWRLTQIPYGHSVQRVWVY